MPPSILFAQPLVHVALGKGCLDVLEQAWSSVVVAPVGWAGAQKEFGPERWVFLSVLSPWKVGTGNSRMPVPFREIQSMLSQ